MKITIVGTGYVGLVTGTCFADQGNHVVCLDTDASKVERLSRGECTIYEPGLEELMNENITAGRLSFTTNYEEAVNHGKIVFLCVGTPPKPDGHADLSFIEGAARQVAELMNERKVVVIKSTVPVGTGDHIEGVMRSITKHPVDLVSNPEFLKEGAAVADFRHPDRVVIGAENEEAADLVNQLYEPFRARRAPIYTISRRASEMCKYAANSYLAMRISFINEISNVCERVGVDVDEVKLGMASDKRIGSHFMFPGIGYGGSCFPKDVQALANVATDNGYNSRILEAVHESNEDQKKLVLSWIEQHYGSDLKGRRFALWGVTFKSRTDDLRESPALTVIDGLLAAGAEVLAYDPQGLDNLQAEYGDKVTCVGHAYDCMDDCDALLVLTEWDEFRSPDFDAIRDRLREAVIMDGRKLYNADWMRRNRFTYYSVGRGAVVQPKFAADANGATQPQTVSN